MHMLYGAESAGLAICKTKVKKEREKRQDKVRERCTNR